MPVDLLQVLPDFDTRPYAHLLPSLDKALITTNDLVTLEPADVAKRAQVPATELAKLSNAVISALHRSLGFGEEEHGSNTFLSTAPDTCGTISTLDPALDEALGGGIAAGYLVEVAGESGAGKTQLLLTLLLASQLPSPHGLSKSAIYVSTEASLATNRLFQLLSSHPLLASLPQKDKPSLSRILSIQTPDLESQEHILRYQLPVAIKKHNVGLVVIDSIAANYRAEFEKNSSREGAASMAKRGTQLTQLGALLRDLARTEGIAIVVANQVADRFAKHTGYSTRSSHVASRTPSDSSDKSDDRNVAQNETLSISEDALALDHQQRWFTGWGDDRFASTQSFKTPSLGLVWTNQVSCRIALIKQPVYASRPPVRTENGEDVWNEDEAHISQWRRLFKVVFCPWAAPTSSSDIEFEVVKEGLKHIDEKAAQ